MVVSAPPRPPSPWPGGPEADRLFHALADATRRDIVTVALQEPCSVSALARRYPMSVAAVQKHVIVLEQAGLVVKQRRGREQLVIGQADAVAHTRRLLEELEALWRKRLDRFSTVLGELTPPPTNPSTSGGDTP